MAQVMYHILMAAFVVIPLLLIVFFVIARTSSGWEAFTLERNVSYPVAGWCLLIAVAITVVGSLLS